MKAVEKAKADAERMGLELILTEEADGVALWDIHQAAWSAWQVVCGQWRTQAATVASMGASVSRVVWIGLDYQAARAGLEMSGVNITPDLWTEVRAIEAGAIEELNRGR